MNTRLKHLLSVFTVLPLLLLIAPVAKAQPVTLYSQDFNAGGLAGWGAYSGANADGLVQRDLFSFANGPDASAALNLDVFVDPSATFWFAGVSFNIGAPNLNTPRALAASTLSLDVYAGSTGTDGNVSIAVEIKTPNNGALQYIATVPVNTWASLSRTLSEFANINNFDFNGASFEILVKPADGGGGWLIEDSSLRIDNVLLTQGALLPIAPDIQSALTAFVTVNKPFTYTITATELPTAFSATGLPSGLTFNGTTGVISGTPTVIGTTQVTIGATNAQGNSVPKTLAIVVGHPGQIYYADALASNTYFWGRAGWHNAGGSLTFLNGYLSYNSANLPYVGTYGPSGRFPWEGGYARLPDFSPFLAAGNSVRITFQARASLPDGVTGVSIEVATGYDPSRYYIATSPALTNQWQSFTLSSFTTVGIPVPTNIQQLAFTTGGPILGIVDVRNVKIEALISASAPPAINSASVASIAVNTPFTYTITAVDSPTSFSASGLPVGLVINPATGIISGTPTVPGVTVITLGAANANGSTSAKLTLTVTSDTTLSPLQSWSLTFFGTSVLTGTAAPDADFDGDGLPNLLEYALNLDPTIATSALAPSLGLTAQPTSALTLTFMRARAEITYEVFATSNLADPASWQVIATNPGAVSTIQPVTVTDPLPVSTNPRRFLRLRVSQ